MIPLRMLIRGERVDESTIRKLLNYLGEPEEQLEALGDLWATRSVTGRCLITPTEDGITYELRIRRTMVGSRATTDYRSPRRSMGEPYRQWYEPATERDIITIKKTVHYPANEVAKSA